MRGIILSIRTIQEIVMPQLDDVIFFIKHGYYTKAVEHLELTMKLLKEAEANQLKQKHSQPNAMEIIDRNIEIDKLLEIIYQATCKAKDCGVPLSSNRKNIGEKLITLSIERIKKDLLSIENTLFSKNETAGTAIQAFFTPYLDSGGRKLTRRDTFENIVLSLLEPLAMAMSNALVKQNKDVAKRMCHFIMLFLIKYKKLKCDFGKLMRQQTSAGQYGNKSSLFLKTLITHSIAPDTCQCLCYLLSNSEAPTLTNEAAMLINRAQDYSTNEWLRDALGVLHYKNHRNVKIFITSLEISGKPTALKEVLKTLYPSLSNRTLHHFPKQEDTKIMEYLFEVFKTWEKQQNTIVITTEQSQTRRQTCTQ